MNGHYIEREDDSDEPDTDDVPMPPDDPARGPPIKEPPSKEAPKRA
jgi:hypothetical protein